MSVEIIGTATDEALRLPYAAMTSRDRLWVVQNGELVERPVEILGRDDDTVIVTAFDTADGVVAVPPPDVRAGLLVDPVFSAELASVGGVAGAAKK